MKASTLRGPLDCIQPSLDQLDLLLTGGRIHNKAILRAAYDEAAGSDRYKARNRAKKTCAGTMRHAGGTVSNGIQVLHRRSRL